MSAHDCRLTLICKVLEAMLDGYGSTDPTGAPVLVPAFEVSTLTAEECLRMIDAMYDLLRGQPGGAERDATACASEHCVAQLHKSAVDVASCHPAEALFRSQVSDAIDWPKFVVLARRRLRAKTGVKIFKVDNKAKLKRGVKDLQAARFAHIKPAN